MVLALFRTLEFKKLFYRYLYYKYWRFFLVLPKTILNHLTIDLLLYYLYCLCKFLKDRFFYDCCSFQKADAKVRTLKYIFQIIPEVFLFFFSLVVSLIEREKKEKRLALTPSLSECQTIAALVLESGCKSTRFINTRQTYLSLFYTKYETFL
jgi:hypothetical protein